PGSLHVSGKRYAWKAQCSPAEVQLAEPPAWLLELKPKAGARTSIETWRKMAAVRHPDGERTDTICRLAGHLIANPWNDPVVILALLLGYNRGRWEPPLPDERVIRIVDDFCGREIEKGRQHGQR